jgi:MFS family permease
MSKAPALFADRNFRWLIGGGVISMLGDQFSLVALPWLVLKLTGDTLMLGLVLAVMSVPRAIFILIGGAVTDRYAPKRVLMLTKYANVILLGTLASLVLGHQLALWMLFALAFAIGLASAFSIPSGSSIVPLMIAPAQLQAANGLMMALRQVTMLVGPLLAGLLIVLFGDQAMAATDTTGIGLAFLFDAASFAISAWTLTKVVAIVERTSTEDAMLAAVVAGLRHFWNDHSLRTLCLYFCATAFFIGGPVQVALPVLAAKRLDDGAAGFGSLMAAHGAGTLIGMILSGARPTWRVGTLGTTILLADGIAGLLVLPLGRIEHLWQGAALLLPLGLLSGFMMVTVFTWMQRRVPQAMLGRAMSLFMFIFMGVAPISAGITGWLMRGLSLEQVFAGSGIILILIVLLALANPRVRAIGAPVAGA